jgi:hypothetical protein
VQPGVGASGEFGAWWEIRNGARVQCLREDSLRGFCVWGKKRAAEHKEETAATKLGLDQREKNNQQQLMNKHTNSTKQIIE